VTCGAGEQSRTRACNNPPPKYGGKDCLGNSTEEQPCINDHCPGNGIQLFENVSAIELFYF